MRIALDTDALILLMKRKKLEDFVSRYEPCITVITEYEYVRGEVRAGVRADESKSTLEEVFDVLPLDNRSIKIASEIWSALRERGLPIDERDLLIGAICIAHGVPLWTLNVRHFMRLVEFGLKLVEIDPESLIVVREIQSTTSYQQRDRRA